jgi:hypothetical protein
MYLIINKSIFFFLFFFFTEKIIKKINFLLKIKLFVSIIKMISLKKLKILIFFF